MLTTLRPYWLAAFAACCLPAAAPTQTITFTRFADTTTPIPSGTGAFSDFRTPSLSDGMVAFVGGGSLQFGVYTATSTSVARVVDTTTPVPSGTGTFGPGPGQQIPRIPTISGGVTAFIADGGVPGTPAFGVYANPGGILMALANQATPVPSGTGTFPALGFYASISGDVVAFRGRDPGTFVGSGIYSNAGGTLAAVANRSTPIPGGTGTFADLRDPRLSGSTVAFRGTDSVFRQGIYTNPGGTLGVVANFMTAVPSGTGVFNGFGEPAISGSAVAFVGFAGGGQEGVYTNATGTLTMVANKTTPLPGGTGTFTSFGGSVAGFDEIGPSIAMSGGSVAFLGLGSSGQAGIYTNLGGSLMEVIGAGDMLDGKVVGSFGVDTLRFGPTGFDGDQLAFVVRFTDFSSGLYVATITPIPEPTGLLPVTVLVVGAVRWIRARKRAT